MQWDEGDLSSRQDAGEARRGCYSDLQEKPRGGKPGSRDARWPNSFRVWDSISFTPFLGPESLGEKVAHSQGPV